jgi:uncharacterized protein YbaA (DUF1428 family)
MASSKGYVDMYMLPVPKRHVKDYCKISQRMGRIMRGLGATEYREFVGTDLRQKGCKSFLDSVDVASGQVLVFAVVGFKSKSHRDSVNKRMMRDPRVKALIAECMTLPWLDMKGSIFGGFETIVKA